MLRLLFPALFGMFFLQPAVLSESPLLYSDVVNSIRKVSDPDIIPVMADDQKPVEVSLSLMPIAITEADADESQIELIAWLMMGWTNPALAWTPSDMNNVTNIRLQASDVWIPDISLFNGARNLEKIAADLVVVSSDGGVVYVPALRMTVLCDLGDLDSSPVTCGVKLGSWTYSGLHLTLKEPEVDTTEYRKQSRFELISASAKKEVKKYECCPEPYESAQYEITFKRREQVKKSNSFVFNIN